MAKHITAYGAKAIKKVRKKTPAKTEQMPGPTENPATNLRMGDVAIRAGSYIARRSLEKGMLRGRYGKDTAREIVQNKTLGQTLVSFGLAKLATKNLPGALLVGPEGGFHPDEVKWLADQDNVFGLSLGPRVLKAETAAIALIAVFQALVGDGDKHPDFRGSARH